MFDETQQALILTIARACHEANRVWAMANNDFSQKPWEEADEWQRESVIKGVIFRLNNQDATQDAQHNAWMQDKLADGWVFGSEKDAAAKTHPCLVSYAELPVYQRKKDALFCAIVDALR